VSRRSRIRTGLLRPGVILCFRIVKGEKSAPNCRWFLLDLNRSSGVLPDLAKQGPVVLT
jgi:hypothetical protein